MVYVGGVGVATLKNKVKEKIRQTFFGALSLVIFLLYGLFIFGSSDFLFLFGEKINNLAGTYFTPSITVGELAQKKTEAENGLRRLRILIVPGHEPDYGGTEYGELKEREMVLFVASELKKDLEQKNTYEVIITRNENGWNPIFSDYFTINWDRIESFRLSSKNEMDRLLSGGFVFATSTPYHNEAPSDVARRLFGINLWANENDIDIVLHLHLNDYPRKNAFLPGKYQGFSIYIPEKQYSNSEASRAMAKSISNRLSYYFASSTMPGEVETVVEDQELIATGRYNTVDPVSVLIEYGYIYEPGFLFKEIRPLILREYAFQTYLGLEDFFNSPTSLTKKESAILPYYFEKNAQTGDQPSIDIFALQMKLSQLGLYPPVNYLKEDCPLTGKMAKCTKEALSIYQKEVGVEGDGSILGPRTRQKLNALSI